MKDGLKNVTDTSREDIFLFLQIIKCMTMWLAQPFQYRNKLMHKRKKSDIGGVFLLQDSGHRAMLNLLGEVEHNCVNDVASSLAAGPPAKWQVANRERTCGV